MGPVRLSLTIAAAAYVAYAASPVCAETTDGAQAQYRVLATTKTSTMEKELNEGANAGFRFAGVMGGDTSFGGQEVVVIMTRTAAPGPSYDYRLLATNRTSTMQRELQDAADAGFEYRGQTIFNSLLGGEEVVIILERDASAAVRKWEYRLLATNKTGTMQKELGAAGASGFEYVGMTVGKTAVGGNELVVITRRQR